MVGDHHGVFRIAQAQLFLQPLPADIVAAPGHRRHQAVLALVPVNLRRSGDLDPRVVAHAMARSVHRHQLLVGAVQRIVCPERALQEPHTSGHYGVVLWVVDLVLMAKWIVQLLRLQIERDSIREKPENPRDTCLAGFVGFGVLVRKEIPPVVVSRVVVFCWVPAARLEILQRISVASEGGLSLKSQLLMYFSPL